MLRSLRNNILVGLILIIPLVVTLWVADILFRTFTDWLIELLPAHMVTKSYLPLIRVAAFFVVLFLLFLLGLFVRNFLGKRLYQVGDRLLGQIPILSRIYVGIRQVIEALISQRDNLFKEVVLLEYPRKGLYSVGFVTAVVPPETRVLIREEVDRGEMLSVFIPTTPNPTSGWFCLLPRQEVITLPMSTGEAMKLIVSGGAVYPGHESVTTRPTLLDRLDDWLDRDGKVQDAQESARPGRPS